MVVLGHENELTGDPRQPCHVRIYTDASEAREARARLEALKPKP
jgi:hypothetical protein